MKEWISFPRREGKTSRQAHADFPDGAYERELGKEGFFGPVTEMYHKNPPTSWTAWEGPLKPRAFDLTKLTSPHRLPWDAAAIMTNKNVRFRFWNHASDMTCLVRNGDGDELLFIHEGSGHLYTDYGHMEIRDGDYVLLPRGTMWRIDVTTPMQILLIEATNDSYKLPHKGIVGPQAIFDSGILDVPEIDEAFKQQQSDTTSWQVIIKRREELSTVTFPYNPLDAMGWQGTLMPVRINWRDIRPLMSHRYHLPPSAHTTFLSSRFVVCTFCPRPLESDPGALKVPFYHNNDDFDEVLFYHRGDFFSRDNIHPGMVTIHPCGFTHGPHPKAFDNAMKGGKKETDEVAVMIDTRDALDIEESAKSVEWEGYVNSWGGLPERRAG
ncbi:MAG: homogentisate 1,2-dioxygenase [Alphaproteobacteria bacterium]